jgi:hypothetical protein
MRFRYAISGCFAGLVALSMSCSNPFGGTDTGNPEVSGVLFNKDGSRAKNALVRMIPADYNPRSGIPAPVDSAVTNDTGMYSFDSLPTNIYNVSGNSGGVVSFQDSVVIVAATRTAVPPDTLKDPGTLRGVVRLQPGDDCRTVFMIVMGTTVWPVQPDSLGNFLLSNLAEGDYRLRVISTLDQYQPLDMVFTIGAGKTTTLPDTIRLRYTGIPIPTGERLVYDSLKNEVTLGWDRADMTLVKGYCVYRSDVDENTTFEQINRSLITDTLFVDSVVEDSTTYAYKICAVDKGDNKGKLSSGVQVRSGTRLLPKVMDHPQSTTFDVGGSASLEVNAIGAEPFSYAWYKRTGDSIYRIPGQTAREFFIETTKATDSGVYFCEVSNRYGSVRSNTAYITINCNPRIVQDPQPCTVFSGSSIGMTVVAEGPGPFSFTWYRRQSDAIARLADQNGNQLLIDTARLSDTGCYFCIVSNSFGSDTSECAQVIVDTNLSPVIIRQPRDTSIAAGQYLLFKVIARGTPPLTYTWYKNGIEIQSSVDDTILWFYPVNSTDGGTYRCIVRNDYGADTSVQARLTVTDRTENTLALRATNISGTYVSLTWTNSGAPYDSLRVWYATTPLPDSNISPTVYSQITLMGASTTEVIGDLTELTTYYFGIQGSLNGIWSNIPSAAKTTATTTAGTSQAIPNTKKKLGVKYYTHEPQRIMEPISSP